MKMYTAEALERIEENTIKLYARLAGIKPTDDFTLDDIRNTMWCLKAFGEAARAEKHCREKTNPPI